MKQLGYLSKNQVRVITPTQFYLLTSIQKKRVQTLGAVYTTTPAPTTPTTTTAGGTVVGDGSTAPAGGNTTEGTGGKATSDNKNIWNKVVQSSDNDSCKHI